MYLRKLNYKENQDSQELNPWEIDDLYLGNLSLIIGNNAVGKSRTVNVIYNLALFITQAEKLKNGEWELNFETEDKKTFIYYCNIQHQKVIAEKIEFEGKIKLDRSEKTTYIESERTEKTQISPPPDKLVLHIRRDKEEYPFLEFLYSWAENTTAYKFSLGNPSALSFPSQNFGRFPGLELTSQIIEKLSDQTRLKIVEDFNQIGFNIEKIETSELKGVQGLPPLLFKIITFIEKGLKFPLKQFELSGGMYTAFSLLVNIHYLLQENPNQKLTLIVDDLGANLDYERSTKLAKLLFNKLIPKKTQFIATTNDRFLMNAVSLESLNILTRQGGKVKSKNYINNKKEFDEFSSTGLNNFELFSSDFLKKK